MFKFILILAILFGCPLEGRDVYDKYCVEWSLSIDTARNVGPFLTGPGIEWSRQTPFQSQFVTILHIALEDFFYADYNCILRGDNIPDEECVTTDDIRGQTNFRYTTNCTADCIAELGYTVAITDWITTTLWDLDLDFDGDIDLKDYYFLQQIRILQ